MDKSNFICVNGEYIKDDQNTINHHNRAFLYGDGLFETIYACNGQIHFFADHFERLTNGMQQLKLEIPNNFNKIIIQEKIHQLLKSNKIFQGASIRINVYRDSEGKYIPEQNKSAYIIETKAIPQKEYQLNEKGFRLGIYHEILKPINKLSSFKNINSLIYVLAGIYKKENNFDECVILNEKENICEVISSNIFLVKGNRIYTPSLNEGCVAGTMRKNIIKIAKKNNYGVYDNGSLKPEDLLMADEIFTTNAITGVRWIVAYKDKRYFKNTSEKLIDLLNKEIKKGEAN